MGCVRTIREICAIRDNLRFRQLTPIALSLSPFILFEMMVQKRYGTGNAEFIRKDFRAKFTDFNIGEFK